MTIYLPTANESYPCQFFFELLLCKTTKGVNGLISLSYRIRGFYIKVHDVLNVFVSF